MKFLCFFILCALLSTLLKLPNLTAQISNRLQTHCNSFFANSEKHAEIPKAFLCGQNLSAGNDRDLFLVLSLYHLLVVSGSHLSFVLATLEALGPRISRLSFLVLLAFALVTGLQAPVLRALFFALWRKVSLFFKLSLLQTQIAFCAGLSCLALSPQLWQSSSLQLSWAAGLALQSFRILKAQRRASEKSLKNDFLSQNLIYLMLIPFLAGWGQLNPLGILTNVILAPALSIILWPLSLIWLWSPRWGSQALDILMASLSHIAGLMPPVSLDVQVPLGLRWLVLLIFHGLLYHWERENKCFNGSYGH